MKKRNRRFTLVELLIVIAIIAILAGMLLPALGKARNTARQIACASNLKQTSLGLLNYGDSYGNYVPYYISGLSKTWGQFLINDKLVPINILSCPSDSDPLRLLTPNRSYGFYLSGAEATPALPEYMNLNQIMDIRGNAEWNTSMKLNIRFWLGDSCRKDERAQSFYITRGSTYTGPCIRHNKKTNIIFADAHIETKRYSDLSGSPMYFYPYYW